MNPPRGASPDPSIEDPLGVRRVENLREDLYVGIGFLASTFRLRASHS